jgi:hypothetical protein
MASDFKEKGWGGVFCDRDHRKLLITDSLEAGYRVCFVRFGALFVKLQTQGAKAVWEYC